VSFDSRRQRGDFEDKGEGSDFAEGLVVRFDGQGNPQNIKQLLAYRNLIDFVESSLSQEDELDSSERDTQGLGQEQLHSRQRGFLLPTRPPISQTALNPFSGWFIVIFGR
jgi:hypothetical protein